MRCVYSNGGSCFATVPQLRLEYKPTTEELTNSCNNAKFEECPRYRAILEIIKASKI